MPVSVTCPQSIFLEHESWLRTVVRSRLSEPEAIDDVMQNIALTIVRQKEGSTTNEVRVLETGIIR